MKRSKLCGMTFTRYTHTVTCVHTHMYAHTLKQAKQEVLMSELNLVISDISLALNNINKWISPEYVAKDLLYKFSTAYTQVEPYGVVLVLSPWNYPLLLSLQPLVGVIAAGEQGNTPMYLHMHICTHTHTHTHTHTPTLAPTKQPFQLFQLFLAVDHASVIIPTTRMN